MIARLVACAAFLAIASPALVPQALAGTNVYGGYDIVGGKETAYGEARGWRVFSGAVDGKFAYCAGERADGDTVWRLGTDTMQWQLGVPYMASPGEWQGEYDIDGRRMPASGVGANGWTFMWLGLQELDEVRNGNQIVLDIGRASITHPLKGTAAVITKIEECVSRQGAGGDALAASAAVQSQAGLYPTFEACQPAGSVRTERDGPAASVTFRVDNSVGATLSLNWIAHDGQVHSYGQIAPGQAMQMNTYVGHLWMATDGHACAYQEVEPGARSITFVVDAPPDTGGNDTSILPGTGLPPERAAALIGLPAPADGFGDYYAACSWTINETPFAGDYLLYYAADCKGRRSLLEFAGGAQFAELTLVESALAEGPFTPSGMPLVKVAGAEPGDPKASVLARARAAIDDPARAAKCQAWPGAEWGYPADAFVVDVSPRDAETLSEDERMSGACGPFGVGDSARFWRVFQGFAWFFDLGQDAWQDIDPASLTLVTADGRGGWKRAE